MTVGLGAICFVDGAKLARSKPLRRFVLAPLATSLVCVALLLGVGYAWVADASAWVWAKLRLGRVGWAASSQCSSTSSRWSLPAGLSA